MLDHERLDMYQVAIQFLSLTTTILDELPRGHASIADQLRRAAISIPLNIADGSGKLGHADRRRYRQIARGSAYECAAVLDVLQVLRIIDPESYARGKGLLVRLVAMLTKLGS